MLETTTGKERWRYEVPVSIDDRTCSVHAFSRNGDLLAIPMADATTILIVDIRRGKEIAKLNGSQGEIRSLAFGADMSTLFTGGSDGTVLIWKLDKHIHASRKVIELSRSDCKRLWTELADSDTKKAYRALAILLSAPAQTVDLIGENVKPIKAAQAGEIERLIGHLDSGDFRIRDSAFLELRNMGSKSKAALIKTLEKKTTIELRRRVEGLLAELMPIPNSSELRDLRAIEMLEAIHTSPARSILRSLAKGASGVRLTDEAILALERLEKIK